MTSAIDPIDAQAGSLGEAVPVRPTSTQWSDSSVQPHVYIGEFDIADVLPRVPPVDAGGRHWTAGQFLVRCVTEPVGLLHLDIPPEGLEPAALAVALDEQLGSRIQSKVRRSGIEVEGPLTEDGLLTGSAKAHLERLRQPLSAAPEITVVICTRDRPGMLRESLSSLEHQDYPALRVLVVDNAPTDAGTRHVASELSGTLDLDYVVESRPGLSWARNRAIDASTSGIIAWLDDDEKADRWWVTELARALTDHPEAGAVSGITLPAEIESPAQLWFEQSGGHHKGRGFESHIFSPATRRTQSPLYPRPQFGTGGNMAFRREAIESIGRFNTALGAGTPAMGGEDTAAFSEYLYSGGTLIYHPPALVWHTHRSDMQALRALKRGYGRGISAFYLSFLLRHPEALLELIRLFPKAVHDIAPDSDTGADHQQSELTPLLTRELYRGLLEGMPMYLLAAWRSHRLADSGESE
jgi:glycosyltransferase involved in cell wall biosynthesis